MAHHLAAIANTFPSDESAVELRDWDHFLSQGQTTSVIWIHQPHLQLLWHNRDADFDDYCAQVLRSAINQSSLNIKFTDNGFHLGVSVQKQPHYSTTADSETGTLSY